MWSVFTPKKPQIFTRSFEHKHKVLKKKSPQRGLKVYVVLIDTRPENFKRNKNRKTKFNFEAYFDQFLVLFYYCKI